MNPKSCWFLLAVLILIVAPGRLIAQTNCPEKLVRAERLYEQGLIEEIPGLLNACLEKGFSKEERMEAYKLLINTYIYDNNAELADEKMEEYLRRYPEYQLSPTDPEEFSYLYNTYIKTPVLSLGLRGGINSSFVSVLEPFAPYDLNNQRSDYSPSGIGFQLGLMLEKYIRDDVHVNLEFQYASNSINSTVTLEEASMNITNDQSISRIAMPLSGTYDFEYLGFNPFARIGFSPAINFNSTSTLSRTYTDNAHPDIAGPDLEVSEHFKTYSFWAFLGGGVKYSIAKGYIFFDTRINIGLNNLIDPASRWTNQEMIISYMYENDDFTLYYPAFSLGWVYSFYNPRKKTN